MKKLHRQSIEAALSASISLLVITCFVCQFGFHQPLIHVRWLYRMQTLFMIYFIGEKLYRTWRAHPKAIFWRTNWMEVLLTGILGLCLIHEHYPILSLPTEPIRHHLINLYLLLQVIIRISHVAIHCVAISRNPSRVMIASFLAVILIGAGALSLPNASTHEPVRFINALFTATSATCVTGLVINDTGADWTLQGQCVILTLIQLGGLGIVVFGAVFALLLRQALTLRESAAIHDLVSGEALSQLSQTIAFIILFTLIIEAIGTLALLSLWSPDPNWQGSYTQQCWFYSLFHAISAFCNAGFGLYPNSLETFANSRAVYTIIAPLIILGGLGFSVLYNLYDVMKERIQQRWHRTLTFQTHPLSAPPKRISLQSKIVLSVTAILILMGTFLLFIFENINHPGDTTSPITWGGAFFQSVTARTAGFNTINIHDLSPAGRMTLMILMFIGGSPGSTAGGIKTITVAILVMAILTTLRKRRNVEIYKRTVNTTVVGRVVTVSTLFIAVFLCASLGLLVTERNHMQQHTPDDYLFEVMSALGTVGLSTGITAGLTSAGKCILILVMLFGRLGPLTLLAALTFEGQPARYSYPEEPLIVG